jgi:hypothetical protein
MGPLLMPRGPEQRTSYLIKGKAADHPVNGFGCGLILCGQTLNASSSRDEAHQEHDEEDHKENLRDTRSRASDSAESQERRDQRNDQKHPGVMKHVIQTLRPLYKQLDRQRLKCLK